MRHLHDIRYELPAEIERGVDALGEFLRRSYAGGVSRFEELLQQTELTARLVFALRDEDVADQVSPIERGTLARIVADLEARGSASLFRSTRRLLREARVTAGSGLSGSSTRKPGEAAASPAAPRARLTARQLEHGAWKLCAALPDIPGILRRADISPAMLERTRVTFADRPESPKPGRMLRSLGDSYEHELLSFPEPSNAPLIRFEGRNPTVEPLITPATQLAGAGPWLLRVQEDEVARQVIGNHVRADQDYLLISAVTLPDRDTAPLAMAKVECSTAGVFAYAFSTPRVLPTQTIAALPALGLGYGLRVRIAPLGLSPRHNAATGATEWLANEEILLRVSSEISLTELAVAIDASDRARIPMRGRAETLLSLGRLATGDHVCEINAIGVDAARKFEPEQLAIRVRGSAPWRDDLRSKAAVRLYTDPPWADFGEFVAGEARLRVAGPEGRLATFIAKTYDNSGHIAIELNLGEASLPVGATRMAEIVRQMSTGTKGEAIESSRRVDIEARAGDLGATSVSFARTVDPLRWCVERSSGHPRWRLIDEVGADEPIVVDRYDVALADVAVRQNPSDALTGLTLTAPGALLIAHAGRRAQALVVASVMPDRPLTPADLGSSVSLATSETDLGSIRRLSRLYRAWRRARPMGPLAHIRRQAVLARIEEFIGRVLCGANWQDRVQRCRGGETALLAQFQNDFRGLQGFAHAMRTKASLWRTRGPAATEEFMRLAKLYGVTQDENLIKLALTAAFDPGALRWTDAAACETSVTQLRGVGSLVRGVSLARLAADLHEQAELSVAAGGSA